MKMQVYNQDEFLERFYVIKNISIQDNADVMLLFDKKENKNGKFSVIKIFKTNKKQVKKKMKILEKLDCANVIRPKEFFYLNLKGKKLFSAIFEYYPEHDLFEYQSNNKLEGRVVRNVLKQCVQAVKYLHDNRIAHGDIKSDNFLVRHQPEDVEVALADFEYAIKQKGKTTKRYIPGTFLYRAPETFKKSAIDGFSADIYSLGILFFTIMTGFFPYANNDTIKEDIISGNINIECGLSYCTENGLDLVRQMMANNPTDRPTINQVLEHPFFDY
eukprot:TRINITY_DN78882_c0_g2_i1.p1 TRINITY_DN78882_c0_g2~~TRINITY_DN78882_c0_g2_i1.p1  ORF type:complete len:273 (+),score=30.33 TRINITY_DN78882_c0_g2_i1:70-888(+)